MTMAEAIQFIIEYKQRIHSYEQSDFYDIFNAMCRTRNIDTEDKEAALLYYMCFGGCVTEICEAIA